MSCNVAICSFQAGDTKNLRLAVAAVLISASVINRFELNYNAVKYIMKVGTSSSKTSSLFRRNTQSIDKYCEGWDGKERLVKKWEEQKESGMR